MRDPLFFSLERERERERERVVEDGGGGWWQWGEGGSESGAVGRLRYSELGAFFKANASAQTETSKYHLHHLSSNVSFSLFFFLQKNSIKNLIYYSTHSRIFFIYYHLFIQ